ncbi:MAG: hypothetical protein HOH38_12335 [Nitrospinaceae bacterium]|nr:hypothetical protein [Nitrospinaceae bacterium]MBT6345554.1 hypothetical protein [Nitrospina sp.]
MMKNLTIDEILTRMFRDTANRVGWNVFQKDKYHATSPKRAKTRNAENLKKIH